jgi:hypothetical protein
MVRAMTSTSLDADALIAGLNTLSEQSAKVGHRCQTAAELAELPEHVREAVDGILWHRPDVSVASIVNLLAGHGVTINDGNMRRHRRRGPTGCKCPKPPEQRPTRSGDDGMSL